MADDFKILAQGQLPAVAAAIYTVPAATQTIVRHIALQEATGAGGPFTVTLSINGTAAANRWRRMILALNESAEWNGALTLDTGETIRGLCSAATTVTYTISGDEVA